MVRLDISISIILFLTLVFIINREKNNHIQNYKHVKKAKKREGEKHISFNTLLAILFESLSWQLIITNKVRNRSRKN